MVYARLPVPQKTAPEKTTTENAWDYEDTRTDTESQVGGKKDADEELYHSAFKGLGPLLKEFRTHGFNRQIPEVSTGLINQLKEELSRNNTSLVELRAGRPFTPGWLNRQFAMIESFHAQMSANGDKWISHVLVYKNDGSLGSTENAQFLVRWMDDTLKRLIHVVSTLSSIMDCNRTEVAPEAVTFTAVKALSQATRTGAKEVLRYIKQETQEQWRWWENPAALSGEEAFFLDVSRYLGKLSKELPANLIFKQYKVPVTFTSATHYVMKRMNAVSRVLKTDSHLMNFEGIMMPEVSEESWSAPSGDLPDSSVTKLSKWTSTELSKWTDRQKAKTRFLVAKAGNYLYMPENLPHDPENILPDPGGKGLSSVGASLIRSLLWQWQEPAKKIVFASSLLSAKTKELKKIKPGKSLSGTGGEQMLAEMYKLLDADIRSIRAVLERMGNIEATLKHQMTVFTEWRNKQPDEFDDALLPVLMSDTAEELSIATGYLKEALLCASEVCGRDFSTARKLAGQAMIAATTVREEISAVSVRLTGRGLDEYSRGARIARYLAGVLSEHSRGGALPADPDKVLSLLKKEGLLNCILSEGDPEGYLMATRLAGESDSVSHGEQNPLITPEQYVALEKGIVEHVVKWGQRNISAGVSRLIFELSFGAAEFSIKPLKMAWKVAKASIKIPYKIHQVNKHTMPGQNKPYGAIYDMLDKKLAQLGFSLMISPVPGVIATAAGAAAAVSAFAWNKSLQSSEGTVSAIYGRVVKGEKSQQVKTTSAGGMGLDAGLYLISGGGGRAVKQAITALEFRPDGLPEYQAGAPEVYNAEYIDKIKPIRSRSPIEIGERSEVLNVGTKLGGRGARYLSSASNQKYHIPPNPWRGEPIGSAASEQQSDRSEMEEELIDLIEVDEISLMPLSEDEDLSDHIQEDAELRHDSTSRVRRSDPRIRPIWKVRFPWLAEDSHEGKNRIDIQAAVLRRVILLSENNKVSPEDILEQEQRHLENRVRKLERDLKVAQNAVSDLKRAQKALELTYHHPGSPSRPMSEEEALKNEPEFKLALAVHRELRNEQEKLQRLNELAQMLAWKQPRPVSLEGKTYESMTDKERDAVYVYSGKNVLREMEKDNSLPLVAKENAGAALEGEKVLRIADINGIKINNAFFLPDYPGSKNGVLIRLHKKPAYIYINGPKSLPDDLADSLPRSADNPTSGGARGWSIGTGGANSPLLKHTGREAYEKIAKKIPKELEGTFDGDLIERQIQSDFEKYFLFNDENALDLTSISTILRSEYAIENKPKDVDAKNPIMIHRAKEDAKVNDPFEYRAVVEYGLPDKHDGKAPTSSFSKEVWKTWVDILGSERTVRELQSELKKAELAGEFFSVVGEQLLSLTVFGKVYYLYESLKNIAEKAIKGESQDPFELAAVVSSLIAAAKIDVGIGRINKTLGKSSKILLKIANVVVDTVELDRGIELATKTGNPLAVYQVLINRGMDSATAYNTTRAITSKFSKIESIEKIAPLKQIQDVEKSSLEYSSPVRKFKVGPRTLSGRINAKGKLEIQTRHGWKEKGPFYLLQYRLQNAGGKAQTSFVKPILTANQNDIMSRTRAGQEMDAARQELKKLKYELQAAENNTTMKPIARKSKINFLQNDIKNAEKKVSECSRKLDMEVSKMLKVDANGLNGFQRKAVESYTGGSYRAYNSKLRESDYSGKAVEDSWKAQINEVSDAFRALPDTLNPGGEVYRGGVISSNIADNMKAGDVMYDPAFGSTSTNRTSAEAFAKNALPDQVECVMIFKVASIKKIPLELTQFKGEAEVVFLPGTKFEVESINRSGGRVTITFKLAEEELRGKTPRSLYEPSAQV